jgi:predicted DCC family thiol-disulfide oxidoreductase YuxK
MGQSIILFDGVCNLRNSFVQFVIVRDRRNEFKFCPLQSAKASEILAPFATKYSSLTTVVLLQNGVLYTHSTAVLRILKELGGFWRSLYVFSVVPPMFRDLIYNIVAKHRYRLFGKRDSCMVPTIELKENFIDDAL